MVQPIDSSTGEVPKYPGKAQNTPADQNPRCRPGVPSRKISVAKEPKTKDIGNWKKDTGIKEKRKYC